MDTRLKNNKHGWGIFLILVIVLLSAAATVGLYPYIQRKAISYNARRSQWTETENDFGNIATQVMNFSYEIWHQQRQEEEGRLLTYSETFLPEMEEKLHQGSGAGMSSKPVQDGPGSDSGAGSGGPGYDSDRGSADTGYDSEVQSAQEVLEESQDYTVSISGDSWIISGDGSQEDRLEYYRELRTMINELGSSWKNLYKQYNGLLSYAVLGKNGEYLRSNVTKPDQAFSAPVKDGELMFMAEFSPVGQLSVTELTGSDEDCQGFLRAMSSFV